MPKNINGFYYLIAKPLIYSWIEPISNEKWLQHGLITLNWEVELV